MLETIETRELITLNSLGVRIRATYHRPNNRWFSPRGNADQQDRIGIVFLNSLSLPRTATGDSAVHWADSFAQRGYPSCRFDLPGLGDSDGDLTADLLEFINSGGYASAAGASVKELVERLDLSGVVLVGHCAGAISALFAAAACKECKGLILMDPYFHWPKMIRPKVRQKLSEWARRNRAGALFSDMYDSLRNIYLRVRGERPPRNANFQLLGRWKKLAGSGLPILILKAPGLKAHGTKPRPGEFDYLKHVTKLAGRKSQVMIDFIEGTDHSFANRTGRVAVRQHIESWLDRYFPLVHSEESAGEVALSSALDNATDNAKPRTAPQDVGCAVESR